MNREEINVLKKYEEWEAKLIMNPECWENGLPELSREIFEELLLIQELRNEVLNQQSQRQSAEDFGHYSAIEIIRNEIVSLGWQIDELFKNRRHVEPYRIENRISKTRDLHKSLRALKNLANQKALTVTDEWISVEDRLPKDQAECLVYCPTSFPKNIRMITATYKTDPNLFYGDASDSAHEDATHWQPLPTPPINKEQ